jgi:hypothetical protein
VDGVDSTNNLHKVVVHDPWAVNGVDPSDNFHEVVVNISRGAVIRSTMSTTRGTPTRATNRAEGTYVQGCGIVLYVPHSLRAKIVAKQYQCSVKICCCSAGRCGQVDAESYTEPQMATVEVNHLQMVGGTKTRFCCGVLPGPKMKVGPICHVGYIYLLNILKLYQNTKIFLSNNR